MPKSKPSIKRRRSVKRAQKGKTKPIVSIVARCPFPQNYKTERCCMCNGYVKTCPCTFEQALAHAQKFHGLSDSDVRRALAPLEDDETREMAISQSQFLARLEDPNEVIHVEADDDTEIGKTLCGLEIDFGMIVASDSSMASCPNCCRLGG